ncbi:hypothetical protein EK904_007301, partial [Melospiza melodia maxima]
MLPLPGASLHQRVGTLGSVHSGAPGYSLWAVLSSCDSAQAASNKLLGSFNLQSVLDPEVEQLQRSSPFLGWETFKDLYSLNYYNEYVPVAGDFKKLVRQVEEAVQKDRGGKGNASPVESSSYLWARHEFNSVEIGQNGHSTEVKLKFNLKRYLGSSQRYFQSVNYLVASPPHLLVYWLLTQQSEVKMRTFSFRWTPEVLEPAVAQKCGPQEPLPKVPDSSNLTSAMSLTTKDTLFPVFVGSIEYALHCQSNKSDTAEHTRHSKLDQGVGY